MRSPVLKAYALGIITGSFLTAAVIAAKPAEADPDTITYSARYGRAVCMTIDQTTGQHTDENIFMGIGEAVMDDGYTPYQAGQILYLSVDSFCPQYLDRVIAFAHSGDTTA